MDVDLVIKSIAALRDLGVAAGAFFLLWGGRQRWWVYGSFLTDNDERWKRECSNIKELYELRSNEWKAIALANEQQAKEWKERVLDQYSRRTGR